jgi:guanylate kinase
MAKSHEGLAPLTPPPRPLFVVLSGLSGVGKDAVLAGLRLSGLPLFISVSATTRQRRAGEKDGFNYHFVSRDRFQELIDGGELLEWAKVYGNYYGIPKEPVRQALRSGRDVIVKIDVQGAATIKKILPGAVFIFMVTPYMEELEKRLKQRRTETSADLELRLKTAAEELRQMPMFDYLVVNRPDEINQAVADIVGIIKAEKCRVQQRELSL